MKKLCLSIIFLILFIPVIVSANWEFVAISNDNETSVYLDLSTIKADKNNGKCVAQVLTENVSGEYIKSTIFFRLLSSEYCVIELQIYDGKSLTTKTYNLSEVECNPIQQKTLMDSVKIRILEQMIKK